MKKMLVVVVVCTQEYNSVGGKQANLHQIWKVIADFLFLNTMQKILWYKKCCYRWKENEYKTPMIDDSVGRVGCVCRTKKCGRRCESRARRFSGR
jgi:hypothetical protein